MEITLSGIVMSGMGMLMGWFMWDWRSFKKDWKNCLDGKIDKIESENDCLERRTNMARKIHEEDAKIKIQVDANGKNIEKLWTHKHAEDGGVYSP